MLHSQFVSMDAWPEGIAVRKFRPTMQLEEACTALAQERFWAFGPCTDFLAVKLHFLHRSSVLECHKVQCIARYCKDNYVP